MSNFLQQVSHSAVTQTGIRVVISGQEKLGKTTTACNAPGALLVPLETGYIGISVNKTPMLKTFDEATGLIAEITAAAQKKQFKFKTLVLDSATSLEALIHDKTLQADPGWTVGNKKGITMNSALGGYGKAYDYANALFVSFLRSLDDLAIHGGINIVITCHVFASKMLDPSAGEFNCWDLLLHSPKDNKNYGKREILCQWADIVGFLHEPMFVSKASESFTQGISANKGRIMGLERTPAYVAGNRFGIKGEISIAKEQPWNYLAQAIYSASGIDVFNREA